MKRSPTRSTIRFVAIKMEAQRARDIVPHPRSPGRQRAQTINALRWHLAEYGVVAPQGTVQMKRLVDAVNDEVSHLQVRVRDLGQLDLERIGALRVQIFDLDKRRRSDAARTKRARRPQTMPGVGPITAMAMETFAPPMEDFRRSRDFAAWLERVPRQHSTGGKARQDVEEGVAGRGASKVSWPERMPVTIALANKMARGVRAMMTKRQDDRDPVAA